MLRSFVICRPFLSFIRALQLCGRTPFFFSVFMIDLIRTTAVNLGIEEPFHCRLRLLDLVGLMMDVAWRDRSRCTHVMLMSWWLLMMAMGGAPGVYIIY